MQEARIISVASQKGGTGKTTSTINIGAELAACGRRVLLVDLDPQGHLAEGLGFSAAELERDMSEVIDRKRPLADILIPITDTLTLAPSNIHLAHIELMLATRPRREDRLKQALADYVDDYDIILIDCPPSLGLLTVNAFAAAREVLIPMATDFYGLLGVSLLLETIEEMRRELNPDLSVIGILPTRSHRTNHAAAVIKQAKEVFAPLPIFPTPIPELVAVKDAAAAGKPLRVYDPTSKATVAYAAAAQELCQ